MEEKEFNLKTDIPSQSTITAENDLFIEINVPLYESAKNDVGIFAIPHRDNVVLTEIIVAPNNRFKGKYKLIAVGKLENDVEIVARPLRESAKTIELISRALNVSEKDTFLNIMYRGNSEVFTEIQPIGYKFLEAEIEVPPHNRMYAIYEVQQPPIVTDIFNPTQDAFTREGTAFQSINYGSNSSMVVGRSQDDIWRSFVQFDLSLIHSSYILKESYLRLYYKGSIPENVKLEILNANKKWQETNITHLNRPIPIDLITDEFTININQGYVEFDVLKIVQSWVSLEKINNGFIIRLSNETDLGHAIFYTRETISPPELIVKYFDSRIFSQGRSQHLTEIFAYRRSNSEKLTEVIVDSIYSFEKLDTEIYVHRAEVPLDFEALVEITVCKPHIEIEITSSIREDSKILTEIGARRSLNKEKSAEVTINKPFTLAKILCALRGERVVDTTISVTIPLIQTEITVPRHDKKEVLTEIEINETWTSIVGAELFVAKDKITTKITSRVGKEINLLTVVGISRLKIEAEIEVKHRNDMLVEIEANIKSDVITEIIVSKPNIEVAIDIQRFEETEINTEIFVRYIDDVSTEIDVKSVNQVNTVIDIKRVSQVSIEISVNRCLAQTEITIPTWVDKGVSTVIEPRIIMVNNVSALIIINGTVSGYAFIM